MTRSIPLIIALLSFSLLAHAQFASRNASRATIDTAINFDALKPGADAVLAIVVEVKPTFHAQSHTPLDKNLIKFSVDMKSTDNITFLDPIYPEPAIEEYGGQQLSVYTGKITIFIPFKVKTNAPAGAIDLAGKAQYQICDNKGSCFPPENPAIKLSAKIVSAKDEVKPNRPELFENYKPAQEKAVPPAPPGNAAPPTASGPSAPPPDLSGPTAESHGFGWAIGAAFLAGLIFNIMPCVLPVLPIKAIGFFEAAQHDRSRAFMLGVLFSLGVIAFFAVLALPILVFRKVTWGAQFSNPWFIWGITLMLLVMAAGMFGAFNINLPTSIYNFTPRHDTYTGNFLFGAFTALLATPCTAPLLPPLLAWALSHSAIVGVSIMIMIGIGMASPYLLLSGFPEVARKFPRTGPWSELFKQMLGFIVLAFAVYFAAGNIIHGPSFWWAVLAVIAVACIYLLGRTVQFSKSAGAMAISSTIAVSLFGIVLLWAVRANGILSPQATWSPYSKVAFDQARGQGKVVLVKFTANWCVTCQAIEATVFADGDVWKSVHDHGVITLKADMTGDNPQAEELLKQLNPSGGIPLTAIYSPTWTQPLKLESQYTSGTLLKALDAATHREPLASAE